MFRTVVSPSSPLSLFLSLQETHLLTAARLIPPLSTGKKVLSLLLPLLLRAFIHFGSAVCRPVRSGEKKRCHIVDALLIRRRGWRGGGCKHQRSVSQGEKSFEEIKRTEGIMWTHPFPLLSCVSSPFSSPSSFLFFILYCFFLSFFIPPSTRAGSINIARTLAKHQSDRHLKSCHGFLKSDLYSELSWPVLFKCFLSPSRISFFFFKFLICRKVVK